MAEIRWINSEMKKAASTAIAAIAKEPVIKVVLDAYGLEDMSYGKYYVIPKPMDPRLVCVAKAVADAALATGVGSETEKYRKLCEECDSLKEKYSND